MTPSPRDALDPAQGHLTDAALANARAEMAQLERQVDRLWRESMERDDSIVSDRVAGVCHALQQATSLMDRDGMIG